MTLSGARSSRWHHSTYSLTILLFKFIPTSFNVLPVFGCPLYVLLLSSIKIAVSDAIVMMRDISASSKTQRFIFYFFYISLNESRILWQRNSCYKHNSFMGSLTAWHLRQAFLFYYILCLIVLWSDLLCRKCVECALKYESYIVVKEWEVNSSKL